MKAAVIESVGKAVVTEVPDPTPGPRDVVVEVAACGLCGTDLHILQGEFAPKLPIVPGHEFAGEVVGVGTQVTELSVGDRVAVDPSLYCHECRYCRTGHNNLCERWAAIGVTTAGGAARYAVAPVANCVKLPEHVRTQDAALVEPLSCAVRGYDVLQSRLGAHVLIYGSGTMGLMMLELAKRTGAASVDVVDVNPRRLETARRLGVSASAANPDELDRPQGWDLVVDATGNAAAIQDGLDRVAKAGTFLQFGVADYSTRVMIDPYRIYNQWKSSKQTLVATSTNHSEIIALYEAAKESIWLRRVHQHVQNACGITIAPTPTIIYEDNSACIAQVQSGYIKSNITKHISPKFFYTHEMQKNGEIMVTRVKSCDNLADVFTKVLPPPIFEKCIRGLGMKRLREIQESGGELLD